MCKIGKCERKTDTKTYLCNNKKTKVESLLFNITRCALKWTDQAIHWPAGASHHHPPPQVWRYPSYPSYWLRWCASWEPRRWSPHQTAPDPPGQAAPGWALLEAWGSHSSYLVNEKKKERWNNRNTESGALINKKAHDKKIFVVYLPVYHRWDINQYI